MGFDYPMCLKALFWSGFYSAYCAIPANNFCSRPKIVLCLALVLDLVTEILEKTTTFDCAGHT